uniref:Uncharacterized protein n=1 Tax=Tanacetum cinerariifolium TaxID=118510 RepID=A0A699JPK7_TANCI|nr:hypothetical protein [Tanacetum cinerariifolium]
MALELMSKAFQLNNTTPTNNNQRSSSNPCYSQIAQSGMNMDQDRQMLMVEDNVGKKFRPNAVQNVRNQVVQNALQNLDWVIMPATAQKSQGNEMLLIFSNSYRLLKRKKQGSKELKNNLSSWLLQMLMKKLRE